MNKFMTVVTNKWFRLGASVFGVAYSILLAYFDYIVFFYDIEYVNQTQFAIWGSIVSALVCLLFLYTRRSPLTCIFGMVNMVLYFPLVLLDWGNWPLLLPAAVVTLFGFFCCHMNETAKTIFGTIFLLMYILGGIAFFLIMNVFRTTTTDTLVEEGVSPSGAFRYYVLNVENKSTGKMCVYVQPNTLDVDKGFIKLDCTIKKLVKQAPKPCEIECEWSGTKMIINGEVYFDEANALAEENGQLVYDINDGSWSYTYFSIEYPIFDTIKEVTDLIGELISSADEDDEADGSDDTDSSITDEDEISAEETAEITAEDAENEDSSNADDADAELPDAA